MRLQIPMELYLCMYIVYVWIYVFLVMIQIYGTHNLVDEEANKVEFNLPKSFGEWSMYL